MSAKPQQPDDEPIPVLGSDPSDYAALSLSRDVRALLYREGLVDSPDLPTRPIAQIHLRISATGPQGLCADLPSVALAGEAVKAVGASMATGERGAAA